MVDDAFARPASAVWGRALDAADFPAPTHDVDVDVLIIGGGFSGLWTAVQLSTLDKKLRIALVDAAVPGFGASGRNGGWCSALLPMSLESIARRSSTSEAQRMQTAMNDTIDAIGTFITSNSIECGWKKGGYLHSATNPAQMSRLVADVATARSFGFADDHIALLTATEARRHIDAVGTCGATFTPHCAAMNPLDLVKGLVGVLRSRGVALHAHTRAWSVSPHTAQLTVPTGHVNASARWIVRATEGYTRTLAGERRTLVPVYSFMVATEPLDNQVWESIGWGARETFADARHSIIYAQRTADDRIAFGGRGAPYKWASRVSPRFDQHARVHARLTRTLHELFPVVRDARITHQWGGPLGIPRDWHSSVNVDHATGLATLGGYVGDGVALSHLAATTVAHLITRTESDLVSLPWVGHVSKRWEPEPLRYIGINSLLRTASLADSLERRTRRPSSRLSRIISAFVR